MTIRGLLISFISIMLQVSDSYGNFSFSSDPIPERGYDVKFYHLDITVNRTSALIHGSVEMVLELSETSPDSLVFDMGNNLIADSVINGEVKTGFNHADNLLIIYNLRHTNNTVKIKIFYRSGNLKGLRGGIYNSTDKMWDRNVTWTISEPFDSRTWFPCNQDLNDKADSVYVFVTTSVDNKAGSNGILTNTEYLPGNMVRYEWKTLHPVAYYLISFAVSNYSEYSFNALTKSGDTIPVVNYIYDDPAFLSTNKETIDKTADFIDLFTNLFGPYPFSDEKYGHCIVPSGGGMEHQTMTTLDRFSFNLVSHELAHQWFGNYVTCGSWQDIWINEGFASYAEYLALEFLKPGPEADNWMSEAHRFSKSAAGSIYVPDNDAENVRRIFDYSLSYKKGAAIIHMIRHKIGNDILFFSILRDYLFKFGNGNAIGMDFCDLLEEKTGIDFTDFFNQWYFGQGYPMFDISWKQEGNILKITSVETTTGLTPFFNITIDLRLSLENGNEMVITREQESETEVWEVSVEDEISDIEADPYRWLIAGFRIEKESYAKELILEEQ